MAFTTTTVSTSQFVVRVGGPGELSSVETSEGQTIITAQQGGDAVANLLAGRDTLGEEVAMVVMLVLVVTGARTEVTDISVLMVTTLVGQARG